ncbi:hypothetical protein LG293_16105 (plasmid) [Citricoccus nitrophenolicus]
MDDDDRKAKLVDFRAREGRAMARNGIFIAVASALLWFVVSYTQLLSEGVLPTHLSILLLAVSLVGVLVGAIRWRAGREMLRDEDGTRG